jgi:hypothetical protein
MSGSARCSLGRCARRNRLPRWNCVSNQRMVSRTRRLTRFCSSNDDTTANNKTHCHPRAIAAWSFPPIKYCSDAYLIQLFVKLNMHKGYLQPCPAQYFTCRIPGIPQNYSPPPPHTGFHIILILTCCQIIGFGSSC